MAINTVSTPTSPRSAAIAEGGSYPAFPESVPPDVVTSGSYSLRFARAEEDLDAIQRLRFEIFNLELGEGLPESFATGRDVDIFDAQCHHLIVEHREDGIVGTYRIQSADMARAAAGFYTDGEYDLGALPPWVLADGVELGRACVAREHRKKPVLFLLWRGLATYIRHNSKRYLFGCCSLTSQDAAHGWRTYDHLLRGGYSSADCWAPTRPAYGCDPKPGAWAQSDPASVEIPPLFDMYLRFGGKVCGPPALDREFKTIDFLVVFDVEAMDPRSRALFFDRPAEPSRGE
jgi:putative hemolysin